MFLLRPDMRNQTLFLGILAEHRANFTFGVVFKAHVVNECIDDLLLKSNYRRVT